MLRPMTVCLFAPGLRDVYTLVYTDQSSPLAPALSGASRRVRGAQAPPVDSRDKPVGIGPPPHSPYNQSGPAESPESPCAFQPSSSTNCAPGFRSRTSSAGG